MDVFVIGDPLIRKKKLKLINSKLSCHAGTVGDLIRVHFEKQGILTFREFWKGDVEGVILHSVRNLVMNSGGVRSGNLRGSSDLDLDSQSIKCMWVI